MVFIRPQMKSNETEIPTNVPEQRHANKTDNGHTYRRLPTEYYFSKVDRSDSEKANKFQLKFYYGNVQFVNTTYFIIIF